MVAVPDIYHREWNDVSLGIKRSGLWWAVVASTLVLDLGFGPWAGRAWFAQWLEGAEELARVESGNGMLFNALYPSI